MSLSLVKKKIVKWFLGAITDEVKRTFNIKVDFLTPNLTYEAIIYADRPEAHWKNNPQQHNISKQIVTSETTIDLLLTRGGTAIQFRPIK